MAKETKLDGATVAKVLKDAGFNLSDLAKLAKGEDDSAVVTKGKPLRFGRFEANPNRAKQDGSKTVMVAVYDAEKGGNIIGEFVPSQAAFVASIFEDDDLEKAASAAKKMKPGRERLSVGSRYL